MPRHVPIYHHIGGLLSDPARHLPTATETCDMFQKSSQNPRQPAASPRGGDIPASPGGNPVHTHGLSRIGGKTTIQGDISGEEDLLIEGRILGDVLFRKHGVTVGAEGVVEGRMVARELTVRGRVDGTLIAAEKITLKAGAVVNGQLHSPGLVLEEGAAFHGNIDMEPEQNELRDAFDTGAARIDSTAPESARLGAEPSLVAEADIFPEDDRSAPVQRS
ncbi:polymer-forming cytoskeletal protein [Salinicola corii]|uniref:Polymer-forming cytoskeletal protein n=2 Tax=Salinicola corii TaxID=2606937 RepID=A0A640WDH4_9GAMM|nr:polymer-forming cytoskeletal protein [Salinicola corii]